MIVLNIGTFAVVLLSVFIAGFIIGKVKKNKI
jgi:VIT1/CCC1 family predicted Fe2+/Mn2+ transporter